MQLLFKGYILFLLPNSGASTIRGWLLSRCSFYSKRSTISSTSLQISQLHLGFTNRLNAALLSFDIDQNIDLLKNVNTSLRALNQRDLADQVDNIIDILFHIRDVQIPDIQNQTVSGRPSIVCKVRIKIMWKVYLICEVEIRHLM